MAERGNYRATFTVMLDDKDYRALPERARHLLLAIKASRINSLSGIFVCGAGGLVTLQEQTGIPLRAVQNAIKSLSKAHWLYYLDGIMWVRNQLRFDPHLKLTNHKQRFGIERQICSLPASPLVAMFCNYYNLAIPDTIPKQWHSDTIEKAFGYHPIASRCTDIRYPISETETDTETDTHIRSGKKPDDVGPVIPFDEIIKHLNQVTRRNFKPTTASTRKYIRARWNEGFRLPDFLKVNQNMAYRWIGTKWERFLRPITLYNGEKFEGYLNDKVHSRQLPDQFRENLQAGAEFLRRHGVKNETTGLTEVH